MPQYFFHLRDGQKGVTDHEGASFRDDGAAHLYAVSVAHELMRNCELSTRHWSIIVMTEAGRHLAEVPFATIDPTLNHLGWERREAVETLCSRYLALAEVTHDVRGTMRRSRALVARSRGRPFVATDNWGERV
jgi:hypothetical protein